nr:hypothetical protein [Streptomyces sp. TRM68367]
MTSGRPNVSYVCVVTFWLASVTWVTWPRSSYTYDVDLFSASVMVAG